MRLQNYITEIAQKAVNVKITKQGKGNRVQPGYFHTQWKVNDVLYQFTANEMSETNMWSVDFDVESDPWNRSPYDPTKLSLSHAGEVFSGVKESIRLFSKKHPNVELLEFAAANQQLLRVYQLMAKRVGMKIVKTDDGFALEL